MKREDYIAAFEQMGSKPIIGTHRIGILTITVNALRWTINDGRGNTHTGMTGNGAVTRNRIHTALMKWLNDSNIR